MTRIPSLERTTGARLQDRNGDVTSGAYAFVITDQTRGKVRSKPLLEQVFFVFFAQGDDAIAVKPFKQIYGVSTLLLWAIDLIALTLR